jgi:hypothetical protein
MPRATSKTTPKTTSKPQNDETLQGIAEQLEAISDILACIHAEIADISFSGKMMTFFKMIELRPEMKEKLGPMFDEMVASMDLDMDGLEDQLDTKARNRR